MNQTDLYCKPYTCEESGDRWLLIYYGVFEQHSTNSDKTYPAVRFIGNVNLTQRFFLKGAKFPRKVVSRTDNTVILNGYDNTLTHADSLFTALGLDNDIITAMLNIINATANNPNMPVYKSYEEEMNGQIPF